MAEAAAKPKRVKRCFDKEDNGVWCICGHTDGKVDDIKNYLLCGKCNAYSHRPCYIFAQERAKAPVNYAEFASHATAPSSAVDKDAINSVKLYQVPKRVKRSRTVAVGLHSRHPYLQFDPSGPFTCVFCQSIPAQDEDDPYKASYAYRERVDLMLSMVNMASYTYSRKVFKTDDKETVMCVTPKAVVDYLRTLIQPDKERTCIDIGSGSGSFSAALPPGSACVEILKHRYEEGQTALPAMRWYNADALDPSFYGEHLGKYDLVISNPDFEVGMQFLQLALLLVRNASLHGNDDPAASGRLIFLLPTDFFEGSKSRMRLFKLMDFHIEQEYRLGHLQFYAHNPFGSKLNSDSLFVIRPGRGKDKFSYPCYQSRIAGKLRGE